MKRLILISILFFSLIGNVVFAIEPQHYISYVMEFLDPSVNYNDYPQEAYSLRKDTNCLGYALGYDLYIWPWSEDYPTEYDVEVVMKQNYGFFHTSGNDGKMGAYGNNGTIGHFVRIEYDNPSGYYLGNLKNRYMPDGPVFTADNLNPFLTYGPLKMKFK